MKFFLPAAAAALALCATGARAEAPGAALNAALQFAASTAEAVAPDARIGDNFMITRMYGGPDGELHIDKFPLPRTGGKPGQSVQSRLFATDVELGNSLPGYFIDWHGVSTPRLLIILSGQMEIGLGDGSKHILKRGDVVLAADTTGRGHTSRGIGDEVIRVLTVRLPKENSLAPKMNPCPPGMADKDCVSARLRDSRAAPPPAK